MSNNIQLISLDGLELSKGTIEVIADNLIINVIEGFDSALETDIKLKFIEETVKLARGKINTLAISQSVGVTSFEGCKITAKKGGQTLDYEKDETYRYLKEQLDKRKYQLDMASKCDGFSCDSDGVEIPKVPVKTFIKDSISYTFKK